MDKEKLHEKFHIYHVADGCNARLDYKQDCTCGLDELLAPKNELVPIDKKSFQRFHKEYCDAYVHDDGDCTCDLNNTLDRFGSSGKRPLNNREVFKALVKDKKCPECNSTVNRPKCIHELGADCPRHEVKNQCQVDADIICKEFSTAEVIFKRTEEELAILLWKEGNGIQDDKSGFLFTNKWSDLAEDIKEKYLRMAKFVCKEFSTAEVSLTRLSNIVRNHVYLKGYDWVLKTNGADEIAKAIKAELGKK